MENVAINSPGNFTEPYNFAIRNITYSNLHKHRQSKCLDTKN
jgi:hypothetical protein